MINTQQVEPNKTCEGKIKLKTMKLRLFPAALQESGRINFFPGISQVPDTHPTQTQRPHHCSQRTKQSGIIPETLRKEHNKVVFSRVKLPEIISKAEKMKLEK